MRRFAFAVVVTASVFGCSDEAPPPFFADMQWQLRCRVMGMCSGIPSHDINNVDGEDDHDIECTIDGAVDETRTFYMKAYKASDYGVEIRNANFTGTGSAISGAGCIVKVVEGANTFRGACGANAPSSAQPCQITNFRLVAGEVLGELYCESLPNEAAPTILRELTRPGVNPDDARAPLQFRMSGCRGL